MVSRKIMGVSSPAKIGGVESNAVDALAGITLSRFDLAGDATAQGGIVSTGRPDPWLEFNSTDYITTPTVSTTNWGAAKLSFGMWLNLDAIGTQHTFANITQDGRTIQAFVRTDGKVEIYYKSSTPGGPYFAGPSTTVLTAGTDHFIWIALNGVGTAWEIWIDGVNQGISSRTDHGSYNMTSLFHWGRTTGGSQQLVGAGHAGIVMDEYIGASFTPSLPLDIYNAGAGKISDSFPTVAGMTVTGTSTSGIINPEPIAGDYSYVAGESSLHLGTSKGFHYVKSDGKVHLLFGTNLNAVGGDQWHFSTPEDDWPDPGATGNIDAATPDLCTWGGDTTVVAAAPQSLVSILHEWYMDIV